MSKNAVIKYVTHKSTKPKVHDNVSTFSDIGYNLLQTYLKKHIMSN